MQTEHADLRSPTWCSVVASLSSEYDHDLRALIKPQTLISRGQGPLTPKPLNSEKGGYCT